MYFYLISLSILFVLSIKGYNNRLLLLFILLLSFFLGFRAETIGEDTSAYIEYYDLLSLSILSGYMEKGWNIIAITCKYLGLSAYGFHFVVALMTLLPFYYVCAQFKNSKVNGLVVFLLYTLGFYFHMFNIMRQFLAISIVLIGYAQLAKGCKRNFIICIIIASFIHLASLFVLIMVIFEKIKLNTYRVIWLLLLSFIIGIVASESFFLLFAGKYAHDIVDDTGIRAGILLYILTVGLLTNLFTIWLYKRVPELRNNAWVRFNILSVIVFNMMCNLVWGARLVYYFSICSVFAYSFYAVHTNKKIISWAIYLFAIITFTRYLVPEFLKYGIDGSMIPYEMNIQLFAH